MQFRVPQNIDMEDKIVGSLTLLQLVYLLTGGLIVYILFQLLGKNYFYVFLFFGIPIGLATLAITFLKIQDQPLSYFIKAGLSYFSRPKIRFWQRKDLAPMIKDAPVTEEKETVATPIKRIEKSNLEKLSYALDTQPITHEEKKFFGKITSNVEELISKGELIIKHPNKKAGGASGTVGQT